MASRYHNLLDSPTDLYLFIFRLCVCSFLHPVRGSVHLESAWFLLLDDLQIVITSYQAESELFISNISLHAGL